MIVRPGETVALVGPNGSGKSTLLRAVAGLHRGASGTIRIDNEEQSTTVIVGSIGAQIDGLPLYRWLSVKSNLELAAEGGRSRRDQLVTSALTRFGAESYANKRVRALSQGMTRRAELAAASVNNPGLLLLDEPADTLDTSGIELLIKWLQTCRQEGTTVLIATHSGPELDLCDRVIKVHP